MDRTSPAVLSKPAQKTMAFTRGKLKTNHQYLPSKTTTVNRRTMFPLKNIMPASETESKIQFE